MTAQRSARTPAFAAVASAWPQFAEDEIEAVTRVLRSGRVNRWTGEECNQFEKEFAAYTATRFGISLANGTLALELALRVLNVGFGDEVITTPRSFFASAGCVMLAGAKVVFADVDPDSQNITAASIEAKLTARTKAVIVVHLGGWPAQMDEIMELAQRRNVFVIEDCAQAHGARFKGQPVGGIGHLGAFSFCQDKIMTTGGEGGMLVLNDERWWRRAWSFKDHGKNYDRAYAPPTGHGFKWLHDEIGTNWRLTEMQAAIGRVQLRKLDGWVATRRKNAGYLARNFRALPGLRSPEPSADAYHSYYKYYTFVRNAERRDPLQTALRDRGIPAFIGSCPEIYRETVFSEAQRTQRLPIAERLGRESLMFQVDPTMTESHLCQIADAMKDEIDSWSSF